MGGPSGDAAIKKFSAGDINWFGDFPDKRESIGGRLENFIFCRQEHLTILTSSYLEELIGNAGLRLLQVCLPMRETGFVQLFKECLEKESENDFVDPHTLIMECQKPER